MTSAKALAKALPVALRPCSDYSMPGLLDSVNACCQALGIKPVRGDKVLVKPNLVSPRRAFLSCTHPSLVRAVCVFLLDHGTKVQIGDSPAFGSAQQVAKAAGLTDALCDLPVSIVTLGNPVRRSLDCGICIGISNTALDADLLFNIPKFKAHGQLFVTAAVKNLFGCVSGVRKALAHVHHGQGDQLAELIVDLLPHLPPTVSLVDAITAMQGTGPIGGSPCTLGFMGASGSAPALDTALYTALNFTPDQVPLWRVAQNKNLPGSTTTDLCYPLARPEELALSPFQTPRQLTPVSFHPWQLTKGMAKRIWLALSR